MYWKQQKECNPEQARFLERLHQKIESSLRPFTEHDPQLHSSFRWLHSVAQLRCCLSIVADILNDHVKNSPTRPALSRRGQHALSELVQLLANVLLRDEFQDLSLYLSKQIARKHGMKSLRAMFSQGLHFVLPKSLHSDDVSHISTIIVMLGFDLFLFFTVHVCVSNIHRGTKHILICMYYVAMHIVTSVSLWYSQPLTSQLKHFRVFSRFVYNKCSKLSCNVTCY